MNCAEAHQIVAAAAGRRTTPAIVALEWALEQLDKVRLELADADRDLAEMAELLDEANVELDALWEENGDLRASL